MFTFDPPRKSRRPSLTPMIDVVFLLLVFFMLAARFGHEVSIPLSASGTEGTTDGAPRVVTLSGAQIALNERVVQLEALPAALDALASRDAAPVFLQSRDGTSLQELVRVLDALTSAGGYTVVIVEQQ